MPLFLAGLLVRGGVVAPQLMEDALQRHVLAGGSLDSSLFELGGPTEEVLREYLAKASGLPPVPPGALDAPDPKLRRLFPLRLADRHGVVPFEQVDRTLRMACAYPVDAALLEEMGFLLSQRIEAYIAPEFRVRLAIERLYGHPAGARMHEIAERLGAPLPASGAVASPAAVTTPEQAEPPSWTVSEALALLDEARNRDEAIEVTLRFARRCFDFVALFGVVGGKAIGWDALGDDAAAVARIEQVVQPLDEESVLATVVRTQGRYLGPLSATEGNEKLLEQLGRPAPQTAFVHPVEVGGRIVALVWADHASTVAPVTAAEVMVVVQALGQTLERLIRERKAAVAADGSASASAAPTQPAPAPEAVVAPAADAEPIETSAPPQADAVAGTEEAPAAGLEAALDEDFDIDTADEDEVAAAFESALGEAADSARLLERAASQARADGPEEASPQAARADAEAPEPPAMPAGSGSRTPLQPTALLQACRGAEQLLAATSDKERAAALALIAGSGAVGAEVLVALLPGPLRYDESGTVTGGPILDALAALGTWAVPALARAASSGSASVRYWVAVLLGGIDDPAAHAALARLTGDPDPQVAAVARQSAKPAA